MTSILAFLFVLGVLIFVHEFGHFIMARRIGVRVITFSLGFGPKLLTFRRGDTEYCISAIPLGGYVKMAGETPEDARTGSSDEFLSKSKWQRFQVLVMGPVMNLALAVIVMALVLLQGAKLPAFEDNPVIVGGFTPNSVAEAAGLQVGDRIISVDDRDVPTWRQFDIAIATRANRPVRLVIERDGKRIERQVVPASMDRFDTGADWRAQGDAPADCRAAPWPAGVEGGLRAGDAVLAAAGESKISRERLIELIQAHEGRPLTLDVQRGDERLVLTVVPRRHRRAGADRRDDSTLSSSRPSNRALSRPSSSVCNRTGNGPR